jgi:hypothetical protein
VLVKVVGEVELHLYYNPPTIQSSRLLQLREEEEELMTMKLPVLMVKKL